MAAYKVVGKHDDGREIVRFYLKNGKQVEGVIVGENKPFGALMFCPSTGGNVYVKYEDVVEEITEPAPAPPRKGEKKKSASITE